MFKALLPAPLGAASVVAPPAAATGKLSDAAYEAGKRALKRTTLKASSTLRAHSRSPRATKARLAAPHRVSLTYRHGPARLHP